MNKESDDAFRKCNDAHRFPKLRKTTSLRAIVLGHYKRWTGTRNSTEQVTNTCLRGVLVAISIPIFTSQLEKAREAVDMATAYAEVSADVLADPKEVTTSNSGYSIAYKEGVYTATINATQKDTAKWTGDTPNIGGTSVAAATS